MRFIFQLSLWLAKREECADLVRRVLPAMGLAQGPRSRRSRSQPRRQMRVPSCARLDGDLPDPSVAGIEEVVTHECPLFVAGLSVPRAGIGIDRLVGGESMQGARRFEVDPPVTKIGRGTG